jgi:hypothetical protein
LLIGGATVGQAVANRKEGRRVDRKEIQKLEAFFRKRFNMPQMEVKQRPQKDDSAELYIGDEFIGVLYRDDEDGDLSYNFTMAILDIDLE